MSIHGRIEALAYNVDIIAGCIADRVVVDAAIAEHKPLPAGFVSMDASRRSRVTGEVSS